MSRLGKGLARMQQAAIPFPTLTCRSAQGPFFTTFRGGRTDDLIECAFSMNSRCSPMGAQRMILQIEGSRLVTDQIEFDAKQFRNVAGLFATGVTVVATEVAGETHGMTANAVLSLSLDPMLFMVCVVKTARMAEYLKEGNPFCCSILAEDQQDLSSYFAHLWKEEKPPAVEFVAGKGGPRLKGCIGAVGCEPYAKLEGGDHWIILGKVVSLYTPEDQKNPLLFFAGRYRRIAETP